MVFRGEANSVDPRLLEHRVAVVRGSWYRLQHIPVLDHLAVSVEAEDVDACGFLAPPVQVTHVHKGEVAIDRDAFDFAGYAPGLLNVTDDGIETIREKWVVLNVGPAHEIWIQVRLAFVENLVVDCVEHALDVISGHVFLLQCPYCLHRCANPGPSERFSRGPRRATRAWHWSPACVPPRCR